MELYLIKNEPVKFRITEEWGDDYLYAESHHFPITLEPVPPEHEDSNEYCKIIGRKATGKGDFSFDHELVASLIIPISTSGDGDMDIFACRCEKPYLFDALVSLFEEKNLSFHLGMKEMDIRYSCGCVTRVNMETEDWEFPHNGSPNRSLNFEHIKFPEHDLHPEATIDGNHEPQCKVTLIVKLNQDALAKVSVEGNPAKKYKRLLDEAIGSDLVIVAGNGTEVKCHRSLLMVSCDAFRAMFENKMKEDTTNRLEMIDMSEEVVRAFLNFIYTSDVEAASRDFNIALELFRVGDKYGMLSLTKRMKALICSKPAKWFSVDMAVRLSLLVQDMEEKEEIFKKTAEVLKWYSKNSFEKLQASEEYVELFQKYPHVGMKLVGLFLKFA